MTMNHLPKNKGFTLIEIVVAIFIGLILTAAIYHLMITGQRSSGGIEKKIAAHQDVRAALQTMALEIGMASYNPLFRTNLWVSPGTCSGPPTNVSYKGIQAASPTSLSVEMDIGQNGRIGAPDKNEIITYDWNTGSQVLTRQTDCGTQQSFLSDTAGNSKNVRVINDQLGIQNGHSNPAVFRYFDGKNQELYPYNCGGPPCNPNDITKIRRIDIILGVETEEIAPDIHDRRSMIYSTSVLVRNHVLSP